MAHYVAQPPRLYLEPLSPTTHLEDLFELSTQPNMGFWSTHIPPTTIAETKALIQRSLPTPDKPWNTRYAIMLHPNSPQTSSGSLSTSTSKSSTSLPPLTPAQNDQDLNPNPNPKPKMIGIIGTPREADIGYRINENYWGKGYMTEALAIYLDLFWSLEENKQYAEIIAAADVENIASQRVLEKAGFEKGEISRECYERAIYAGQKKSDLQNYLLKRPVGS